MCGCLSLGKTAGLDKPPGLSLCRKGCHGPQSLDMNLTAITQTLWDSELWAQAESKGCLECGHAVVSQGWSHLLASLSPCGSWSEVRDVGEMAAC